MSLYFTAKPDNEDGGSDHTSDTPQTPYASQPHTPHTPKTPHSARFEDNQFFGKNFSLDTLADAAISRPGKGLV